MALPSLIKTWRFRVNELIASGSSHIENAFIAMVNALLGGGSWTDSTGAGAAVANPWTVVSSNGRLTGPTVGANVLTSASEVVWASSGNRFWIILQNVDGVQLCLFSPNTANKYTLGIKFSISGAFAGGTATVVPSAADETPWSTAGNWYTSTTSSNTTMHILHSTDGRETRVLFTTQALAITTLHVGRIRSAKAAVANPFYFGGISTGNATLPAQHSITGSGGFLNGAASAVWMRYTASSLNVRCTYTAEGAGDGLLSNTLPAINEYDNEYPLFTLGVAGVTTGGRGRIGLVTDVWLPNWNPRVTGDQYPDSGTLRQFAQIGNMVYPWNRSIVNVSP